MASPIVISADIGGTHITTSAIDLKLAQVIPDTRIEMPVDNLGTATQIVDSWANALKQTLKKVGFSRLAGISFAMPGPFDYVNGISLIKGVQKFESLYGLNVQQAIRSELLLNNTIPIRFINDATAFALGETWGGSGKPFKRIIAITLGTGFGSAYVEDGLPVIEDYRVPRWGCLYHIPLNNGIADDNFSTRWFVNEYKIRSGKIVDGVRDIAIDAKTNPIAQQLFNDFGRNLGQFLGPWLKLFDADGLVIGGNVSKAYNLFEFSLNEKLRKSNTDTKVVLSKLKEDAALIGCAHLIQHDYYNRLEPLLAKM
ncbi:MAG: ROK family protein [Bacteroidales bacterium]|nr:MAG: ROK family protein [Bacteroidales bacterium]